MDLLKNKRVLFFAADLFGYQNEIKKAIERQGALVDYFDERPANSFFVKALIRVRRSLLSVYIDSYYNKIIQRKKLNKLLLF